jgi:hypothetical protein
VYNSWCRHNITMSTLLWLFFYIFFFLLNKHHAHMLDQLVAKTKPMPFLCPYLLMCINIFGWLILLYVYSRHTVHVRSDLITVFRRYQRYCLDLHPAPKPAPSQQNIRQITVHYSPQLTRDFRPLFFFSSNNFPWVPDTQVKLFLNMTSNSRR